METKYVDVYSINRLPGCVERLVLGSENSSRMTLFFDTLKISFDIC